MRKYIPLINCYCVIDNRFDLPFFIIELEEYLFLSIEKIIISPLNIIKEIKIDTKTNNIYFFPLFKDFQGKEYYNFEYNNKSIIIKNVINNFEKNYPIITKRYSDDNTIKLPGLKPIKFVWGEEERKIERIIIIELNQDFINKLSIKTKKDQTEINKIDIENIKVKRKFKTFLGVHDNHVYLRNIAYGIYNYVNVNEKNDLNKYNSIKEILLKSFKL